MFQYIMKLAEILLGIISFSLLNASKSSSDRKRSVLPKKMYNGLKRMELMSEFIKEIYLFLSNFWYTYKFILWFTGFWTIFNLNVLYSDSWLIFGLVSPTFNFKLYIVFRIVKKCLKYLTWFGQNSFTFILNHVYHILWWWWYGTEKKFVFRFSFRKVQILSTRILNIIFIISL